MNIQPIEKRFVSQDGGLEVVEVFATIQGEGPLVGMPSVFVRLAGCDLQCPLCDTNYTEGRQHRTLDELMQLVKEQRKSGLIVLTGGEPLRQACGPFVARALAAGYSVQVETNGTIYDDSLDGIYQDILIVVSPKSGTISERLERVTDAFKYVVKAGAIDEEDGLPTSALGCAAKPARPHSWWEGDIFVQPCDEQDQHLNKLNTEAAIASCLKHGYRLCLQMHKLVGLP